MTASPEEAPPPSGVDEGRRGGYDGLTECASLGVHEHCLLALQKHLPAGARVLDIAAGAGAFTQRILDAGFRAVANDIHPEVFEAKGVTLYVVDLDRPFSPADFGGETFDAVVGIEIVEHLENPGQFLRCCRDLVGEKGLLLLTTPETSTALSRFRFLRHGYPTNFDPRAARELGHVSPLFSSVQPTLLVRAGWEVIEETHASPPENPFSAPWRLRKFGRWLLLALFRPLMSNLPAGGCRVILLRRSETVRPPRQQWKSGDATTQSTADGTGARA